MIGRERGARLVVSWYARLILLPCLSLSFSSYNSLLPFVQLLFSFHSLSAFLSCYFYSCQCWFYLFSSSFCLSFFLSLVFWLRLFLLFFSFLIDLFFRLFLCFFYFAFFHSSYYIFPFFLYRLDLLFITVFLFYTLLSVFSCLPTLAIRFVLPIYFVLTFHSFLPFPPLPQPLTVHPLPVPQPPLPPPIRKPEKLSSFQSA